MVRCNEPLIPCEECGYLIAWCICVQIEDQEAFEIS